jgi:hypothetical protein
MLNYYIYYRVLTDDIETERQIRGMQAKLTCRTGVQSALLKRHDDLLTWMETYTDIGNISAFNLALQRALSEFDIAMFTNGNRVTECFTNDAL